MSLTLALRRKDARRELGDGCYPISYVTGEGDLDDAKCYINPDKPGAHGCKRIDLPIDSHFLLEPVNDPNRRECGWLWGQSGCGKSTLLARYALRYNALWPRRGVYLVSQLESDETLDPFMQRVGGKRIKIASLVEKPLTLEELGDDGCLALFDVCFDALPSKAALIMRLMYMSTSFDGVATHSMVNCSPWQRLDFREAI